MNDRTTVLLLEQWLVSYVARLRQIPTADIDITQPFAACGLSSLEGIALVRRLGDWLGLSLPATLTWDHPTIEELVRHLARGEATAAAVPVPRETVGFTDDDIAIVGLACRFPGAPDAASFWRLLCDGGDAITEVPTTRWDPDRYFSPNVTEPGKMVSRWGGFLDHLDRFDAPFFRMTPREAAQLDPRQRLALEVMWEALEDAGIPPDALAGSATAVYMATLAANYGAIIFNFFPQILDAYSGTGNGHSVVANRLSYQLGLRGPSVALDTACSGSLVAVHLACQSLKLGEATLALAGGVNVILKPEDSIFFSKTGALSPDGRCKTFDRRANGIVRSEGAGIVVLKTLSAAIADGDRIYAVIRGSGVNHDGSTNGIMAPSGDAQLQLLREVYGRAGISPGTVQYVEAHGTGTALGDPIEVGALGQILGEGRPAGARCALGSVKTNIGHTEAAAGMAGLIKTALAVKHRMLPPNLHFEEPNPLIPFEELPLRVQQELGPWPQPADPLIAGVSAFSYAGANAHVVLGQAPASAAAAPVSTPAAGEETAYLLPLSAQTPAALRARATDFLRHLSAERDLPLPDLAFTAGVRRSHLEHRLSVVAGSGAEVAEKLAAFLRDESPPGLAVGQAGRPGSRRVAFVFSGQGGHWLGMGQELFGQEPVFRATLEACDRLLGELVDWSLLSELHAPEAESRLDQTDVAQLAVFAIQVALAALWLSWGIEPEVVAGQSLGEVAAAHVAGALSLRDALHVAFHRGRLMKRTAGGGATAVVGLPPAQAQAALAGADGVSVAGSSSRSSTVISGDPEAIERTLAMLAAQQIFGRRIPGVDVAFHSPQMEPLQGELAQALADLEPRPLRLPLISSVTGAAIDGAALGPRYWAANLREPFRMGDVLEELVARGCDNFIEINAHPVLSVAIMEACARPDDGLIVPSLRRRQPERATLLSSLGALYAHGIAIDWRGFFPRGGRLVALPPYPWQRERHWFDDLLDGGADVPRACAPVPSRNEACPATTHPLLGRRVALAHLPGQQVWDASPGAADPAYLADHRVGTAAIMPGGAYLEMALAGAARASVASPVEVRDVSFRKALFFPPEGPAPIQTVLVPVEGDRYAFQVFGCDPAAGEPDGWHCHATATIATAEQARADDVDPLAVERVLGRCPERVSAAEHYAAMAGRGLNYGPSFRVITEVWKGSGEAVARLRLPEPLGAGAAAYQVHPVLLDGALQAVAQAAPAASTDEVRLPVSLERLVFHRRPRQDPWCHVQLRPSADGAPDLVQADIRLHDDEGIAVEIEGMALRRVGSLSARDDDLSGWFSTVEWQPEERWEATDPGFLASAGVVERLRPLVAPLSAANRLDHYVGQWPYLDRLCAAYVIDAFLRMGWEFQPDRTFTLKTLARDLNVYPIQHRYLGRLLRILMEEGILAEQDGRWTILQHVDPPNPELLWREASERFPDASAELTLVKRGGERLPDLLTGTCDALEVLFAHESDRTLESLYGEAPAMRVYNALIQEAVAAVVQGLPDGRTLRILEIGAGTGATTSYVLPILPPDKSSYLFTDVSPLFTARAMRKFAAYRFFDCALLDIEADPATQGIATDRFDVVLATNVLHATADLRRSLEHVKQLLAPGGLLILLEGPGPQRWLDLVVGGTPGWWKFTDLELRPDYPLLGRAEWSRLLAEEGFTDVHSLTDDTDAPPQFICLAQAPLAAEEGAPATAGKQGSWLVLADRGGLGARLAERIRRGRGDRVTLVYQGEDYRHHGDEYVLPAADDGAYARLLDEAVLPCPAPLRGVVSLWSLDVPPPEALDVAALDDVVTVVCGSVMNLLQGLAKASPAPALRFWLVTRDAQPAGDGPHALNVGQAPLWGIGRVLALEHPELWGGLIDLDPAGSPDDVAALYRTITTPDGEDQVAFRGGRRHVARLTPTRHVPPPTTPPRFRSDRSYLITGGLGGLGLEVASWLVAHGARHLVLIGRTPLPPRPTWDHLTPADPLRERVAAVQRLEAMGATVRLPVVDVGDEGALAAVLADHREGGGPPFAGLVHAAGLIRDQFLIYMGMDAMSSVTRPKIRGAWLLHKLLRSEPLEFCVLFSSGTSLVGTIGQANYAAANLFLDSLAHYRRAHDLPAISINWGPWVETGIVARDALSDQLLQRGILPVRSEDGIRALTTILDRNPVQIGAMPADWDRWRRAFPSSEASRFLSRMIARPTATPVAAASRDGFRQELLLLNADERRERLVSHLGALVASIIRVDPTSLDLDAPLNLLGLDSIMAIELKHRVQSDVAVPLSIVDILERASIHRLVGVVLDHLRQEQEELADLLDELEGLARADGPATVAAEAVALGAREDAHE